VPVTSAIVSEVSARCISARDNSIPAMAATMASVIASAIDFLRLIMILFSELLHDE
jgi:hypothetical protein